MLPFNAPIIRTYQGIKVVRDDLIPGGTKQRVLRELLEPGVEYVYASPVYGYAQIALAHTARDIGAHATIFCAKRQRPHPRSLEAKAAGAKVMQVPYGYLSNVQAKARAYCEQTGASLLPFGLNSPSFIDALAQVAIDLKIEPEQVWTVVGSGTLSRALQKAWPNAKFYGVQVGAEPDAGEASIFKAPEKFENDAKFKPPFPSCSNYDAKAWQFVLRHAKPGALFWNVAA